MKNHNMVWLVCATVLGNLSVLANAQTLPSQASTEQAASADASASAPTEQAPSSRHIEFMHPVSASTLAAYRGGASTTNSEMTLSGLTAGNTAVNVLTGANTIGMGAFANMSGLPLVVQNSGANVLIQNAVILNLQMN
jgi:hypothetical protein